ncbi:MAG: Clp1/GlmU family protein [Candidatus Caldatribacteriaceae bacterium]
MEREFWPPEWHFLYMGLADFRGTIMVLAPGDRGKSTLIQLLYTFFLSKGRRIGWIDADLGQSTVGPPTTIGLLMSKNQRATFLDRLFTPYFRFVGDTTPEREILATACYTAELARLAQSQCDVVLLDTCGLFSYPVGYLLKMLKIRMVRPHVVLAIGNQEEFSFWQKFLGERLIVLPIPNEITQKRHEFRRGYRRQCFAQYFSGGKTLSFPLETLRFSLPCYPHFFEPVLQKEGSKILLSLRGKKFILSPDGSLFCDRQQIREASLLGTLCGIFSPRGMELGLGIIKGINLEKEELNVWGVLIYPDKPGVIVPGCLKIDENGEEKGRYPWISPPLRLENYISIY